MDTPSFSENSSDSECSTETSDDEEEKYEIAKVCGTMLKLPQKLCEDEDVFMEFFSTRMWHILSEVNKQHLKSFLPSFPENDDDEKYLTLEKLLSGEEFRFSSPLLDFHKNLKAGHFRPDIARMRSMIKKAERKEAKCKYRQKQVHLIEGLIRSRKKLFHLASLLPPGAETKLDVNNYSHCPIINRTNKRYVYELSNIRSMVGQSGLSSDDEEEVSTSQDLGNKHKRQTTLIKTESKKVFSTLSVKSNAHSFKLERVHLNDDGYRTLLNTHKRKRQTKNDPELDTTGITIEDVVKRAQITYVKQIPQQQQIVHQKLAPKKRIKIEPETNSEVEESDQETIQPEKKEIKIEKVPKIVEEPIETLTLPMDTDNSCVVEEINIKPELMQDTHANFLSLIRDIICSTVEHRMDLTCLENGLKAWQENPISPLNDWYNITDNWTAVLPSAINFLLGEFPEQPDDFVPYLEHKLSLNVYQWIGAGRDSDSLLSPLCQYWLDHRDDMKPIQSMKEIEVERPQTPPPPRCPTTWTVRKADPEETRIFREQERQRYDNPHKAFTYRINSYESVVGPLKGIYNQSTSGVTKPRGHTMLNADRPNFVTILTLVRDATARLPNGEGTRADICELLKSSQYISQTATDSVLQSVVSGALDRMHTEYDPCVKYDTKRKIWIYLHRNRTEADFERIHQQYQGMSKHLKKSNTRKGKTILSKVQKSTVANTSKALDIEDAIQTFTQIRVASPKVIAAAPQSQPTAVLIKSETKQLLETVKQKQLIETAKQKQLIEAAAVVKAQQQQQQQQQQVSLLGPRPPLASPLVAKVLTNAVGQVISVESLLAHQKQHGSLPQGTTLRVSSAKGQTTNLIQISGTTTTQFTMVTQHNNHILAAAPRITTLAPSNKIQLTTTGVKFSPKITHHLINTKFLAPPQPNQQIKLNTGSIRPVTITKPSGASQQIRMVSGLNVTHIGGKPVLVTAPSPKTTTNIRLATTTASPAGTNTQRVVLASQGQGGQIVAQQILLPPGFQGGAINIKALQGLKVIPLAQAQPTAKTIAGRQVFARIMNPAGVVRANVVANNSLDHSTATNPNVDST